MLLYLYVPPTIDIESEFKKYLQVLIPGLLAPPNLVVKEISGQKVRAKELVQYFKSYIEIYKGDELPEPKSMLVVRTAFLSLHIFNNNFSTTSQLFLIYIICYLQATAEANNLSAVAEAKEMYTQLMESVCGGSKPYLSTAHLDSEHDRVKDKCMEQFRSKRKMGGDEFSEKYRNKLEQVNL